MIEKRIIIDCDYEVYSEEWDELRDLIMELLQQRNSKFINMQCYIDSYGQEVEEKK